MPVQTWIPLTRPNTAQKAAANSHATRRRVMALVCRTGGRKGRGVQRMVSGVQGNELPASRSRGQRADLPEGQLEPAGVRRRQRRQRRAAQDAAEREAVLARQASQRSDAEAVPVRPAEETVGGEDAE